MRSPTQRWRSQLVRVLAVLVATIGTVLGTGQAAPAHQTAHLPSTAPAAAAAVPAKAPVAKPPTGLTPLANAFVSPNAYFGMTTHVAGTPNQSALFQVTVSVTGYAVKMWLAIPSTMYAGVPIGNLRISTTLPGGGSLSYIDGGIQYYFRSTYLPAGTRVWMTVQGLTTPPAGSTSVAVRMVTSGYSYLANGGTPGFVTTAPAACRTTGWPADYITTENNLQGDPNWAFPESLYSPKLAVWAENPSVKCGDVLNIRVNDLDVAPLSITAYRLGYYNGAGARPIWRSTQQPWLLGGPQPSALTIAYDSQGNVIDMVTARNWSRSFSFVIDDSWTPGDYLIKVTLSNGYGRYVPVVVRDDLGVHAQQVINNSAEWQAYNRYGNYDAYTVPQSTRISFDRPLLDNGGSGNLLVFEYGYIFWAEKQKLDVSYVFDTDVFANPAIMDGQHMVTLIGHPEYWSVAAAQHLAAVRAAGTNILSLTANALYWRINMGTSSSTGPNREFQITKKPGTDTDTFRMGGMPEQALFGAQYGCSGVLGDGKANSSWLWTGVTPGTVVPGLISVEGDEQMPGYAPAAGASIVDTIPMSDGVCTWTADTGGVAVDAPGCPSACAWDVNEKSFTIMSISGVPGGRVFHASSIGWVSALMNSAAAGQATMNAISFLTTGVIPGTGGTGGTAATKSTDTRALVAPRTQVVGTLKPKLPKLTEPDDEPGQ
jgi:N,N-dimethylformamidase beta subunit-like protein